MSTNRSGLGQQNRLLPILRLSQRMNSEHDLSRLLDLIANEASRLLSAERATIFLRDEKTHELWSKVATGSDQVLRFDAALGIAGAANAGETICASRAYTDPRFYIGVDQQTGFETRTILAVPLQHYGGRIIGAFEVLNKHRGEFETEDVELLKSLAEQAAVAIERARMVGRMQERQTRLEDENNQLLKEVRRRYSEQGILGTSERIQTNLRLVEQICDTSVNVLVEGESGTGKELIARAIHFGSSRARKPFVAMNCAALPDALVESELFGIEKGVATGVDARIGKFESANGGTLFLDEIADLSLTAQAKLLRVLQERLVERLGSQRQVPVDIRVIAATNKCLEMEVKNGRFREDLYYRLNVVSIRTPPLREVPEDIRLIAQHFLERSCIDLNKPPKTLTDEALARLCSYDWPGNFRQLENEMLRVVVSVSADVVSAADVLVNEKLPAPEIGRLESDTISLKAAVEALERKMIRQALDECHQNQVRAARQLGLSRQGLANKMRRYGIRSKTADGDRA